MPNKGKPTATPAAKVTCTYCGKTITKGKTVTAGHGARCAAIAKQFTPAQLQQHYKKLSVAVVPQGFVTVGALDKVVKGQRHAVPGLTISKMVKSFGGDRANLPPANPICTVYYMPNRHRVVHGWLGTNEAFFDHLVLKQNQL